LWCSTRVRQGYIVWIDSFLRRRRLLRGARPNCPHP
jgi:hypothetical protein